MSDQSKQFKPNPSNGFYLKKHLLFKCPLASTDYDVEALRESIAEGEMSDPDLLSVLTQEHLIFSSPRSWSSLAGFLYTFFVVGAPVSLLVGLHEVFDQRGIGVTFDAGFLAFLVVPWLILLVSWLSLRLGWLSGKLSGKLHRQKGSVTVYKGDKPVEKPFKEFDGFINGTASPQTGHVYYDIWLSHKHERLWFACNLSSTKIGALLYWDFIVQYMDSTEPLPDIPELEPFRHLDETTAKWDNDNQRPQKLFEDMSLEDYKTLKTHVWRCVEAFPEGKNREEALAFGWQPPPERIWELLPKERLRGLGSE